MIKKFWILVVLGLAVVVVREVKAVRPLCDGDVNKILVERDVDVVNGLRNYTLPIYRHGSSIWLCFEPVPGTTWESIGVFNSPLSLNNTSGLPVFISGLHIRGGEELRTSYLLSLRGTSPVTLINSSLSACKNCLRIRNDSFHVENTDISCNSRDSFGIGIKLTGEDHRIGPDVDIQGCRIGAQAGDSLSAGNNIRITESSIHDNGTAIRVFIGNGNFFHHNSIFNNDADGDGVFAAAEGINLSNGSNGGAAAPEILYVDEETTGGIRNSLRYSNENFNCQNPPGVWQERATLQLRIADTDGAAELFLTGQEDANMRQGRESIAYLRCTPAETESNGILNCPVEMDNTKAGKQSVLLFHNSTTGSSTFSPLLKLNDPCWDRRGVLSAAELGAPGVQGGAELNGTNVQPGGSGGNPDSGAAEEEESDNQSNMAGAAAGDPSGGGSGGSAVVSGGLGTAGAKGGCGSINPNASASLFYFAWIFIPLGILLLRRRHFGK